MLDFTLLSLFIPTFFLVSITPGMCMTLAMSLGMAVGIRKTLWMMLGELLGVAVVAVAAVLGVSTIMLKFPLLFTILTAVGATYLLYLGLTMWRASGQLALGKQQLTLTSISKKSLFNQGLVTAIANPKGWAFMISLLPPFIDPARNIALQLTVLVGIILLSEFSCMMLYAAGGKTIGKMLTSPSNVNVMNRISGSLMIAIAVWLVLT